MFDYRRHYDELERNVRMAERWRQIADAETATTRCLVCRDALTADELRTGVNVCLVCQPDRLACPSCHEPTVDGRFCGVCLSSSPVGVDASLPGSATDGAVADGPVAGSTPISPSVSPATGPRTERTTK